MIGGKGADRIVGSAGEDLIIAGECTYETSDAALRAILDEWSLPVSTMMRVARFRDGSVTLADGTPIVLLAGGTAHPAVFVLDDDDADQITASNGPDWVFFNNVKGPKKKAVVTDLNPSEDVINDGPVPPLA